MRGVLGGFGIIILVVLLINLLIGGVATEYCIEFWATQIKGQAVNVPFLPCAIAGLFVGEFTIPAAVVTWVLSFVL